MVNYCCCCYLALLLTVNTFRVVSQEPYAGCLPLTVVSSLVGAAALLLLDLGMFGAVGAGLY
ncbi:hypothetical protein [Paenibacillus sp. S150]|uniref:hypothetical protein n=1 Tax=Paenibacillus sp. S150 TaxID=2749826 RepID=UPI001C65E7B4|nr:hypothetical protein [Paenibacillus sp. S150]